jgi:hypothetical protein
LSEIEIAATRLDVPQAQLARRRGYIRGHDTIRPQKLHQRYHDERPRRNEARCFGRLFRQHVSPSEPENQACPIPFFLPSASRSLLPSCNSLSIPAISPSGCHRTVAPHVIVELLGVYPSLQTSDENQIAAQSLTWAVEAEPDGRLVEKTTGVEVTYLCWEATPCAMLDRLTLYLMPARDASNKPN